MEQEKENEGPADLSDALKQSDVKDKDEWQEPVQAFDSGAPRVVRWVIAGSGGLVKNEKQATIVLVAFFVFALFISGFIFLRSGTYVKRGGPGPSEEELEMYRKIQPF